ELSLRINEAFSDTLRESKSTVTLIRYGQRMRDLKDAIKTAARGQSRLVLVAPDGKASMPLITPLRVAGKTIEQSEKEIDAAYQKIIPGMKTSATLLNVKGNIVYVFGAVNRPGFYEMRGPTTMLQAVVTAGGFTPNAETSSALLISRDEENHAVGRLVNLGEVMSTGNIAKDTMVRQADVVFVPNTRLSEAALVADFIRRLIPFSLSATYGIAENLNNGPAARLLQ
ncbi:MAG: polysaccharide export protein, partial [Deltaproteobacteria bacterium]|nr:polysaccharide export protein [Deltaproteobacteria bacterium]